MSKKVNVAKHITGIAKRLRKGETKSEKLLWEKLRGRKLLGLKFRRQQEIGRYITDFLCYSKKIVIEVDGLIHEDRKEYDEKRDEYICPDHQRLVFKRETHKKTDLGYLSTLREYECQNCSGCAFR